MTETGEPYAGFEMVSGLRSEVAALIRRHTSVVDGTAQALRDRWLAKLQEMAVMVEADTFKVLIVGQFSRGKSTLINALLGQKVLPSYARPTTAIINEIKFGSTPQALIYPRPRPDDPRPAPVEVAVGELEKYIRVEPEADDPDQVNPYLKADVFWPIDLCRNGVELIDSPGLDDVNQAREEETITYITKVDAVIMVLDAQQAATRSEIDFYKDVVAPLGHDDAFWVINKFNIVPADEREDVKAHVRRNVGPLTKKDHRIFFVDALDGLRAKKSHDAALLDASGLPELEENLQHFLTLQRGRAKVLVPVRQLQQSIRDVHLGIRTEQELLSADYATLVEKAHSIEVPLERMKKVAGLLSNDVERKLANVTDEVRREADAYFGRLIDRVPELLAGVEVKADVSLRPQLFKTSVEKITMELVAGFQSSVKQDMIGWQRGTLTTLVEKRLEEVKRDVRDEVRDLEGDLRDLRLNLSGTQDGPGTEVATIKVSSHPVGAGMGLVRVGSGFVFEGIAPGINSAIAVGLGAVFVAGMASAIGLTALAPFIIIPAVAIAFYKDLDVSKLRSFSPKTELTRRLRERIEDTAKKQLAGARQPLVDQVAAMTSEQLAAIGIEFRADLNTRIYGLRQQLDRAVKSRSKGEARVASRRQEIARDLAELHAIEEAIDSVIDRVLSMDEQLSK